MQIKTWHKYFNYITILASFGLGVVFLMELTSLPQSFAIGAFSITALFGINHFAKINITLIFIIMIGYMLTGLLNWPLKDTNTRSSLSDLLPSILPFIGFIVLALLYWENRNKF